ncbi:uncharacterized protein LOC124699058 isoform X2 [Lolium rigidum]|uniref:uncharacterized protein LOC124699058 isoform X2 n=1 Tax=Lolium rigidum TaxID=89674 RepID=UPI001F5DCB15|nr:uncharacterized protein LOC124699058 isoform X2 [Lolium rigidum]
MNMLGTYEAGIIMLVPVLLPRPFACLLSVLIFCSTESCRTCCLGVSASGYYHFVLCKRRSNTRNILDMAFNLPICSFRFKLGMEQYSFQYHDYFSGLVQKR